MFLAFKEMRRAKVRFALLMAAISLLVFLILFQQALQNGLLDAFVGAVRNQSAPVLVFSVDGRRNLQGSVVAPDLERAVTGVDGVAAHGKIGVRNLPATAGGQLTQVALIGYEREGLGSPTTLVSGRLPAAGGEVVASAGGRSGFGLGDRVRMEPGGLELTVVGVADEAQLLVSPTLHGSFETLGQAVRSFNPDAVAGPLPNAIGVAPAPGVSPEELAARINAAAADADALTASDAADSTPGVAQVEQSFRVIFLLYGLVVPFVTGLFFLIITFQKAGALTLLRAIGAPARRLVAALLAQVLVVVGGGLLLGTALFAPLTRGQLGGLSLEFDGTAVLVWWVLLGVLALVSALFAVRRVLAIEPVAATSGGGLDR